MRWGSEGVGEYHRPDLTLTALVLIIVNCTDIYNDERFGPENDSGVVYIVDCGGNADIGG